MKVLHKLTPYIVYEKFNEGFDLIGFKIDESMNNNGYKEWELLQDRLAYYWDYLQIADPKLLKKIYVDILTLIKL